MKPTRYLLVGPYPEKEFLHIGGTTILFRNLVDFFISKSLLFSHISTIRFHGRGNKYFNFVYVIIYALGYVPFSKMVILNVNKRGLLYLAPFFYFFTRLLKIKLVLRMFGQDTISALNSSPFLIRKTAMHVLKNTDLLFFETLSEVSNFKKMNSNTAWFPNCRKHESVFRKKTYNKKLLYLGQVKKDKGIQLILDLIRDLPEEYQIEIYGPILESSFQHIEKLPQYKGVVAFEQVYDILERNDVLLLPTFHNGEGYPGAIIEAYFMSVPVITTNWKSIPEIVSNGVSGILIQPGSYDALLSALLQINESNYSELNKGAFDHSSSFHSEDVHHRILNIMKQTLQKESSCAEYSD